jgi:hypothetical protein
VKSLALCVAALTACASAETANGVDAGGEPADARVDAATPIDAPASIDAPPGNACATAATCASAQMLGTVSGDTGAATLSADGYQAAWFRVRVTEDYSDSVGLALRLEASLTSPSSGAFQTFVYVNEGDDVVECSTTMGTVETTGNLEDVRAEWGEGLFPNGADDSRFVTIEVRPSTTACAASAPWHLDVEGNWL